MHSVVPKFTKLFKHQSFSCNNIIKLKKKTCLIHVHLGPLPEWFQLFLLTAAANPQYHWLIFTEQPVSSTFRENISTKVLTRKELETLVHKKTGIAVSLSNPYKVCDLKPLFGLLFEEHLQSFSWWGYCDNDIIFGRMDHFLKPEWFDQYQIISTYSGYLSGPLTFYRNTPGIKRLFTRVPAWESIIKNPSCQGFDENLRGHPAGKTLADILLFPFHIPEIIASDTYFLPAKKEILHQYHWRIKKRQAGKHRLYDMTDIAHVMEKSQKKTVLFTSLLASDIYFERTGLKKWEMVWEQSCLTEKITGKEMLAFHFRQTKAEMGEIPFPNCHNLNRFTLTKKGFHV
ncbi:MAG: DUF6625 family protein [Bacteroidales bacterium]